MKTAKILLIAAIACGIITCGAAGAFASAGVPDRPRAFVLNEKSVPAGAFAQAGAFDPAGIATFAGIFDPADSQNPAGLFASADSFSSFDAYEAYVLEQIRLGAPYMDDPNSAYDFYMRYALSAEPAAPAPEAAPVKKGLSDRQIFARLVELIELAVPKPAGAVKAAGSAAPEANATAGAADDTPAADTTGANATVTGASATGTGATATGTANAAGTGNPPAGTGNPATGTGNPATGTGNPPAGTTNPSSATGGTPPAGTAASGTQPTGASTATGTQPTGAGAATGTPTGTSAPNTAAGITPATGTPQSTGTPPVDSAPAVPTTSAPNADAASTEQPAATETDSKEAGATGTQPGATRPVLIGITNPKGNITEIVYKNTYSVCGVRDEAADPGEPIALFLTRYDAKSGNYIELADIGGEKKWTVGSNGVFTRSVLLEEGENRFAIAACAASVIEAARVEGRKIEIGDVQVEAFVIHYRAQSVSEKISELLKELTIANILKEIENQ